MNASAASSLLSTAVPAQLTIDLDAVADNYRQLCIRTDPAQTGAVVKANAYGLGASRVAPRLWAAGCRFFFVATLDEGLALRDLLPEAEIAVLGGIIQGTEVEFVTARLIPVLNDPGDIQRWSAACRATQQSLPSILHVDTGMARLGLTPAQAQHLAEDKTTVEKLSFQYLMSHLACPDTPDHPQNRLQLERFRECRSLFPGIKTSFANSSGIFLGRDYFGDLTRPGAALYGINPTPDKPNPMRPVVRLMARVLQIRDIGTDESVGYGATWHALEPSRIATIAMGYADGFLRSASNQGHIAIGTLKAPIIGRVSMDLITVDISRLPKDAVRNGDMVEIIGPNRDIDQVALDADTIGYEILTSLGHRLQRHYRCDAQSDNRLA